MTDLIAFEYEDGELVVDSRLIAERLDIQHESFMRTANKYRSRIEAKFGHLRFQIGTVRNSVGAVNEVVYIFLTEPQANSLMVLSRNSDEVIECKLDLVDAFQKAKDFRHRQQSERSQKLVNATLDVYLLTTPVKWSDRGRVFPEDFYREIYRLHSWDFKPGKTRHPVRVAYLTIDLIYERLQPGVWQELSKKNPRLNGKRKYCCHQFLTDNIGNPHLRHHLYAVTRIMQGCKGWAEFMHDLNKYHSKTNAVQLDILFELFNHAPEEHIQWKKLAS